MREEKNLEAAVRAAIKTTLPGLWRFALSLSRQPDVADDLTQATCLRALERYGTLRDTTRLDAWLMTICRSIWLNELRSRTVRQTMSLSEQPDLQISDLKPDAETNIFAAEVFTQVMALPEAQRAAAILVFVEGYSYREAADILDVPIGTIMSRLSTVRAKLREGTSDVAQSGGRDI
ncbi:MAG: RNA polymerase sigma factor [Paracoccaceae bacterium]